MLELVKSKKILFLLFFAFCFYMFVDFVVFSPRTYFPDENTYLSIGKDFSKTGRLEMSNGFRAFVMPLPAVIYGLIYKIVGGDIATIVLSRVIQALILVLTSIGIFVITRSIFKNTVSSFLALLVSLFYPSLVAYQAMLMSECIFIFFLVSGFAFLFHWQDTGKFLSFVFAVVFFSFSVYTRGVLTILTPILVACTLFSMNISLRKKIKYVVLSCVIFAVCLSPWWVRNYKIYGQFVPFALANSNIYLGNNPANTTASIDWGETGADPKELAEIYALKDEVAISNAFAQKAKEYIIANPGTFMKNAWLKFKRFWNFTSNYDAPAEQSLFFRLYNLSLLVSWLPVFLLGMISFAVNWRMWRTLMPIYCLIAYYTFIHVVAIASLRYRLPIEPFFIVMASDTVRRIIDKYRSFKFDILPRLKHVGF